jgi:hypothetical protein
MKTVWIVILVALVLTVPAILIFYVLAPAPLDLPACIDPHAATYADAVERLQSSSEMLVTVTLAIAGAAGVLTARAKKAKTLIAVCASLTFTCAVVSVFFASRIGYAGALTLAANDGDILSLVSIFDSQGIATLLAGLFLGALAVVEAGTQK